MKKNCMKSGITLTSLVIYVVLFSALTVFVSTTYTNMNEKVFNNRGSAINYSNLNKLEYNLQNSAFESNNVEVIGTKINYTNGDSYTYDVSKKAIFKNDGILCTNVVTFTPTIVSTGNVKKVQINIKFNKYLNELQKVIISSVEEF